MRQVELCRAWVIHARNYRDHDMLLDLLTHKVGRLSAVLHGARSKQRRRLAMIQPGQPLLITWSGRNEDLQTVNHIESEQVYKSYPGSGLLALLYLNELLYRLLPDLDACPALFDAYSDCLHALHSTDSWTRHGALRYFELVLLKELGYGIDFGLEEDGRTEIKTDNHYRYEPARGFIPTKAAVKNNSMIFSGATLAKVRNEGVQDQECLRMTRFVAKETFKYVLGQRRLSAYRLFDKN